VIRGDDHLSNTPRQVLVYEALGHEPPVFAHLSMIWGADGKKLSKRHGATSVEAFRDEGYLPEALLNYLALLGWSLDGETTIVPAADLKANFSLERISKNPAIFDFEKLEWMNGVYIRELPAGKLAERILPWLENAGLATAADFEQRREWFNSLAGLVSERLKRLTEAVPAVRFLFTSDLELDPDAVAKTLAKVGAAGVLGETILVLTALPQWSASAIEEALRRVPEALESKPKVVFQIVRVAVTGSMVSPPLFESLELLGREAALERLEAARVFAA
jgi:glutamyl-tRNA synthetase